MKECILNTVNEIRPKLAKGIPEMAIPPMEPLVVPQASLDTGSTFKAEFKNTQVYHCTEFTFDDFLIDFDKNKIEFPIYFPKLRLISDYQISGRLLILDLNGSGKGDGNLTDIKAIAYLNGKRQTKNGKEHIIFDDNRITIDIGSGFFQFDDLFHNNPELTRTTNNVINQNIKEIINELKPLLEDTIGTIVFSVATRVFKRYPLDTLFPIE